MTRKRFLLSVFLLSALNAPGAEPFQQVKLDAISAEIKAAIERKEIPGAVLWIEHNGKSWHQAYGNRMVDPKTEAMTEDTIFDAASLTKVMATTPCLLRLAGKGMVDLDAPVCRYIKEFTGDGKEKITVRQLMTHTSGLRPGIGRNPDWNGYSVAIQKVIAEPVKGPPGTFLYSDINYILCGEIVRRVSGMTLDKYARLVVFSPLGMKDTGYKPPPAKLKRIAPTTREADGLVHGVVHDPTSRRMAGVAGHAGLFTTAADTAKYCRMLLAGTGSLDGFSVYSRKMAEASTANQTPALKVKRGLGWDIESGFSDPKGAVFGPASFGHTGWTGTSLWVDPQAKMFVILLTNRNHPSEKGKTKELRYKVSTLAAEAAGILPATAAPAAEPALAPAPQPAPAPASPPPAPMPAAAQ